MATEAEVAAVPSPDIRLIDDGAPPAADWLFIAGLPRAGATHLVELLNQHPDAAVARDAWLWGYWRILSTGRFDIEIRRERREQAWIETNRMLEATGACDDRGALWRSSGVREFFEGLRRSVAPGSSVFGDTGVYYQRWIGQLQTVFPSCTVVVCTRSNWDRAASMMEWDWFLQRHRELSREELARLALRTAHSSLRNAQALEGRGVCYLPFEEMADAPQRTFGKLLDHLGLASDRYPWDRLRESFYRDGMDIWRRVPELVALRAEERLVDPADGGGVG